MLRINLLLERERPERKFPWIIPCLILLVLLCLLLYSLQRRRVSLLEGDVKVLTSQIEKFKAIEDSIASLKSKDERLREKIAIFNTLSKKGIPSQLLHRIAELRPKGVQIREISLNLDFAEVKGRAWTNRHAARFVQRLKELGSFNQIALIQLKPLESGEGIRFTIRAER